MDMRYRKNSDNHNKCEDNKIRFFTQFLCEEKIGIPNQKPDLAEVVSVIVDPEIVSLRVINTPTGTSYEGQHLSGKKVSIEIKIKQKIMYISTSKAQSVHVVENEYFNSAYIIIPSLIQGSKPEDLIRCKYLIPQITLESVSAEKLDERTIFKNLILFIELKLCPTYVLCYSEEYNCSKSSLYVAYDDVIKKREIVSYNNYRILKPKWCKYGQNIAFICSNKNESFLCMSGISKGSAREITDTYVFNRITSFCWGSDGSSIYFSACMNNKKEIFLININNYEWRQLTYSRKGGSSFKPKTYGKDKKIVYLKKEGNNTNIYIMNSNGFETKRITSCGSVKDFDSQNNGEYIVYVASKESNTDDNSEFFLGAEENEDEIYIINGSNFHKKHISIYDKKLRIRSIRFSPDNKYITFIGRSGLIEDIYIYDLFKEKLFNVTNNQFEIKIMDFDWDSDSTKIYFSCNEFSYYNIYKFEICNNLITQISNTRAEGIKISYRPRII